MHQPYQRQAVTPVVLTFALVCLGWYLMMLLDVRNMGHPVAYALLVVAEGLGIVQIAGVWISIIIGKEEQPKYNIDAIRTALIKRPHIGGKIAVFVPVCGEPLSVIRPTITAARDVRLPHETYVLDDGRSDQVKALATELGVGYLRRADRTGWKAGNLNNALKRVKSDYFVIFDSDHVAYPEFLEVTLPWMLSDPKLAFVQTPQYLSNRDSFVGGGMAETQDIFYRQIQTSKNRFNAAFCVGTNVIFRTAAVMELGGMYDKSHSEDIWTSYILHQKGWKSLYLPTVLAEGAAPETVENFLRQQFRWATGGYELFFKQNPLFCKSLTLDQKLQYLHTSMFFLTGFSVFTFFVMPLLYVYLGWHPLSVAAGGLSWAAHFLPYFLMMFATTAHLLGRIPKWRTFVMAVAAFSAHMAACASVLTGIRFKWRASGVALSNIDHVRAIMMHLLLLLLSAGAIPVLLLHEKNGMLAVTMSLWLVWNCALLLALCRRAFPAADPASAPAPSMKLSSAVAS